MNAPLIYVVRLWIDPAGASQVLAWLNGGHLADVVSQPGFMFVRRVRLDQKSDDGWDSHAMVYGLESRQALDGFFANKALAEKFNRERAPLAKYLRMERWWGDVEFSSTHAVAAQSNPHSVLHGMPVKSLTEIAEGQKS